ncbi:MAG: hypothetical protein V4690_01520 [Patescibacteria group bacterium]
MRKLLLHASLKNILAGESIVDNAETCIKELVELLVEADEIRRVPQYRQETDWAAHAIEQAQLENLGDFEVSIKHKKNEKIVSFSIQGQTLEFTFIGNELGTDEQIDELLRVLSVGGDPQIQQDLQTAVNRGLTHMALRKYTEHRGYDAQYNKGANTPYTFKKLRLIKSKAGFAILFGKETVVLLDRSDELVKT